MAEAQNATARGLAMSFSTKLWDDRGVQTWAVAPSDPASEPKILFDRSWEDRYGDPGAYIRQLVASAKAAGDELVRRGIADSSKLAIGGHSYGAFMAANLIAHSDLFAAGIARSGAYNRSLTPFGFQAEQRTFWGVPEVYFAMSPL